MKIILRSLLASIAIYSIVFISTGQVASAHNQTYLTKGDRTETIRLCQLAVAQTRNPLDRLATLGRQTHNIELLPIVRSQVKGFPVEFVSSSTGELAFAQTDLAFKDNPLLLFQRTYLSSRSEDFGLGRGWSFAFNDSIALNENNAVLTTSTGDDYTYRRAEPKHYVLQPSDSTDVKEFSVENGNTISAKNGDITKIYKRTGGDYYLSQIITPGGFEVTINRGSNGKIRSVSGLSGEINFDWSNGNNSKLLAVTDNTGRRVSFGQSNGSLQNADTATGGKWRYEYVGGKLTNVIDPSNRIALRTKYNASGRTTEVGDAVGLNRLAYETNANISTRTSFTDSLNYTRVFQHNERGILTNVTDAAGTLLSIQYNENSQPIQIADANGATATFEYDAQKRLIRQVAADGGEKVFEYAGNGKLKALTENGERTEIVYDEANLTENRMRRNGRNVKSNFNRRGQEIRLQVENGLTLDFEYDEKGRKTADVHSDIGRFEKTFDAAGRKTSDKSPSGLIQAYEYSADNQLVRQSNNQGLSARGERDASGNLTKIINSATDWVKISRDEAGRIVQLTNSIGQTRRYAYNARGALTRFIGADGRDLQFQYNERGEMQKVINAQNAGLIYQRNQRGSLAKFQQGESQRNLWQIQTVSYGSGFINPKTQDSCFFDDGFGFGEWGYTDFWDQFFLDSGLFGGDCYDPFGSGEFGGGETCVQCMQRETNNCQSAYEVDLANAAAASITAGALCLAIPPPGDIICIAAVAAALLLAQSAARERRDNCAINVRSRCPMCG